MVNIDIEPIRLGVLEMLRVNMGLRSGERLLVVTDIPAPVHWAEWALSKLWDICRRSSLARLVAQIAQEERLDCQVDFFAYPATGRSGMEPGAEVAAQLRKANVVIAITSFSLSHTEARKGACGAGARVASMPGFQPEMFYPGGAMAVDYQRVAEETARLAALLTVAQTATVRSSAGTNIHFNLEKRKGQADDGLYTKPGSWGNLPAGEAYIAPVEGSGRGVLVVQAGWHPGLDHDMHLVFEDGNVVAVEGGGELGDRLRDLLAIGRTPTPEELARRNLAELGIGTNPNARRTDVTLEAEKIRGTVHLALGDNSHMGGSTAADLHLDLVIPYATLLLDSQPIMDAGNLLV